MAENIQSAAQKSGLMERYILKIIANLFGLVSSVGSQLIFSRSLGPVGYGDLNFLNNSFSQLVGLIDSGSSNAFFAKLSQRQKENELVSFYFRISLVIAFVLTLLIGSSFLLGFDKKIWPGYSLYLLILGGLIGFFLWYSQILTKIADAYGITVASEWIRTIQKFAAFIILAFMWFLLPKLKLDYVLIYLAFAAFSLCGFQIWQIKRLGYTTPAWGQLPWSKVNSYFREFYDYCHPLIFYSIVTLGADFIDRWFLQIVGGSVQQSFISLANQIGMVTFLFSSSMVPLLMREFAIAHFQSDPLLVGRMLVRYTKPLFALTAFFCIFVTLNAESVAILIGGGKFQAAGLAVAIYSIYPIHQTLGQVAGSLYYSMGKTRALRNLGISTSLLGLPLTWLFIAKKSSFGLDLGAVGLAFKLVFMQIIVVNVYLAVLSREIGISMRKFIFFQIHSIGVFLLIAFVSKRFMILMPEALPSLIKLLISGVSYAVLVLLVGWKYGKLIGLETEDLRNSLNWASSKLLRKDKC